MPRLTPSHVPPSLRTLIPRHLYSKPRRCHFTTSSTSTSANPSTSTNTAPNRPPTLPKPVLDIKHIRQNPGLYSQNCIDRNYAHLSQHPWRILSHFNAWQKCQADTAGLRRRSKELGPLIGKLEGQIRRVSDGEGEDEKKQKALLEGQLQGLLAEARNIKSSLATLLADEGRHASEMEALALALPNLTCTTVPIGDEPEILEYINHPDYPTTSSPTASSSSSSNAQPPPLRREDYDTIIPAHHVSHVDIGAELDILDLSSASTISGWGFYFLKNSGVLLEHALTQHALRTAMNAGFSPIAPPTLVYDYVMQACGFQPRDESGHSAVYAIQRDAKQPDGEDATAPSTATEASSSGYNSTPGLVLAGTSEIPLAGMYTKTTLPAAHLPLRHVAISRCYRAPL